MAGGTPRTPLSPDGGVRGEESQAAELLAEPDEDEVDEDEVDDLVSDDFDSDDVLDEPEPDDFDAGLLLDEEPRLSLR